MPLNILPSFAIIIKHKAQDPLMAEAAGCGVKYERKEVYKGAKNMKLRMIDSD